MPFCVECGFKLGERDRFCASCGHKSVERDDSKSLPKKIETEKVKETNVVANVNTRILPLYGQTYDPKIHCFNCGSKRGNAKKCSVCNEIEGEN